MEWKNSKHIPIRSENTEWYLSLTKVSKRNFERHWHRKEHPRGLWEWNEPLRSHFLSIKNEYKHFVSVTSYRYLMDYTGKYQLNKPFFISFFQVFWILTECVSKKAKINCKVIVGYYVTMLETKPSWILKKHFANFELLKTTINCSKIASKSPGRQQT